MTKHGARARYRRRWSISLLRIAAVVAVAFCAIGVARAGDEQPSRDAVARGAELFAREWLPGAAKGSKGDGLGPVYNETSCVACHYQGGPGGSGPTGTNVEILSVTGRTRDVGTNAGDFHPGLRAAKSVLLHRFGVDPTYKAWRLKLLGNEHLADMPESVPTEIKQIQLLVTTRAAQVAFGRIAALTGGLVLNQRNPPALFGAGLIDTLSEDVLLTAETKRFEGFPEIRGRVNELRGGRLGRFGWKADSPDLGEFVLSACANELGLEVPGHHQAASPLDPDAKASGMDMTQEECDALVAYVRQLPPPTARRAAPGRESKAVTEGQAFFAAAGCATCHQPQLGNIRGIYSDLLLHDMGASLSDSGNYHTTDAPASATAGVKSQEWRTPPLWGFRDSGPYLHDGRAKTLEEAVAFHGGQAARSAERFFKLLPEERLQLQTFLRTLTSPSAAAR